jgi:hypothetical protein
MKTLVVYGISLVFLVAFYFGVNAVGQWLEPEIKHHEQEAAHCYTAGKMFFVSIACVPKSEPSIPEVSP